MTYRILDDASKVNQFPFVWVWSNNVPSYIFFETVSICIGCHLELNSISNEIFLPFNIRLWHFDWFKTEYRVHHRFYAASTAGAFDINSMEFQWFASRFIWRTQHDRLKLWNRHESEIYRNTIQRYSIWQRLCLLSVALGNQRDYRPFGKLMHRSTCARPLRAIWIGKTKWFAQWLSMHKQSQYIPTNWQQNVTHFCCGEPHGYKRQ